MPSDFSIRFYRGGQATRFETNLINLFALLSSDLLYTTLFQDRSGSQHGCFTVARPNEL